MSWKILVLRTPSMPKLLGPRSFYELKNMLFKMYQVMARMLIGPS
jgi:hypothetical protein